MNIAQFVFFDSSSEEQISKPFGNVNQGSALTIQVDGIDSSSVSVNLSVEGAADLKMPENYFPLKLVSLETFKTVSSITKTGLYMCVIDGVGLIRIKNNASESLGKFKAYAVSIS